MWFGCGSEAYLQMRLLPVDGLPLERLKLQIAGAQLLAAHPRLASISIDLLGWPNVAVFAVSRRAERAGAFLVQIRWWDLARGTKRWLTRWWGLVAFSSAGQTGHDRVRRAPL